MAPSKVTTVDFNTFTNIVNGEPRTSKNKYNGIDPTTKEKLWDVPTASKDDVEDAVKAANSAYRKWSKKSWEERQEALTRFKEVYSSYLDELTELLIKETGKPEQFARAEIEGVAAWSDWHINLSQPEQEKHEDDEKIVTTRFVPLGVVAAICPWNFPVLLSVGKILPAVLTGNAIIVKPSPFTPYSSLKVVELAQQVFPPGLVQVLGGDDKLGPALVDHPDVHKVSFTGSIATGKRIMQAAAKTLKRVTLEVSHPLRPSASCSNNSKSSSAVMILVSSSPTSISPALLPK
jgi:acyl-CoA reductase-like NAD-dependent aldehyde dehydrogenase